MLSFLAHIYAYAEVYTVLLAWVSIPWGFFALYLFFQNHYGMFSPSEATEDQVDGAHR